MKLLTSIDIDRLIQNGQASLNAPGGIDHAPVVKLFTPDAGCTWLISEMDPTDPYLLFGLCDLGLGFPEFGNVYLPELRVLRGKLGLPVERDLHFTGEYTLSVYAEAARIAGGITEDPMALAQAQAAIQARRGGGD